MLYLLIDDSGTPLGEFDEREAAIAALDEHGRRVGEPIARSAAA